MSKHGEGAWLETAARFSEGLPDGPARRLALLERCRREGSDEKFVSRLISARFYALKWMDEDEIRASHKTVEMLRTLDNLNAAKAASVRSDVLKGVMGRPELTLILDDERIESQIRKSGVVSMTMDEVIDQCRNELETSKETYIISGLHDEKGEVFGADAEYFEHDFDEINKKPLYDHRWALVISPFISCSRIFGSGAKGFLLSIAALSWSYRTVSVFCSSEQEKGHIVIMIDRYMKEIFEREKLHFHVASKK